MVLEATMICIDNSEWMRNGDYSPSRFQAQADAVNLICGAKTQSNPENTVGVMTMAGKGVRVLVTPTSDLGKILACMHGLEVGAEANLAAAIQVAQLALKHRQNKRQQQRIIAFIGSPVKYDKKVLETIGKKLKKNNVALDIVDFGETDDDKPEKLEALISAVNSSDSSHIVHVPPGENALSDVLISTPIFTGEEGGSGFAASAAAAAATGAAGFEFDVDPNVDPELALALRLSMEEERARQEAIAKKAAEESSGAENKDHASSSNTDSVMAEAEPASNAADDKKDQPKEDDDAQLLQQALAMSMEEGSSGAAAADAAMAEAAVDDQDLALALQMSVQDAGGSSQSDMSKVFEDRSFVTSILNSLPGVDPSLIIKNLENVRTKDEALEAVLDNKIRLRRLLFSWSYPNDLHIDDSLHLEVLEGLRPPRELRHLSITGYRSPVYPSWLCEDYIVNLNALDLRSCSAVEGLPPSVQLMKHFHHIFLCNIRNLKHFQEAFNPSLSVVAHCLDLFLAESLDSMNYIRT